EIALLVRVVLAARARLELLGRQRGGELLDDPPLLPRQLLWRRPLPRREEIAAAAAVDVGHALALEAQRRAGLRAFGDPNRLGPVERRHHDVAAERDGREVDRDLAEQVDAVAAEELVLLHVNHDVEMACRSAGRSRFAFALQPQLLAGGDPRRNLDRDLALLRHLSGTVAGRARLGDDLAGAAALRAGARDGEEALLEAHLTLAVAL